MKNKKSIALYLSRGAMVAAMYFVLTYISSLMGLDKGVIQFRLSEALCILPVFMPEAVMGLFVGCLISNILTGSLILDVIFGSLATLLGAFGARLLRRLPYRMMWLAAVPTVLSNALIVPLILIFAYGVPDAYWFVLLTVTIGEAVCAIGGGSLIYYSSKLAKK